MSREASSVLTVFTLAAVTDKSLYEHVPQCLIDKVRLDHLFTLARVAGVHAYICNVRLHVH